jgi:hypothetical protein
MKKGERRELLLDLISIIEDWAAGELPVADAKELAEEILEAGYRK